MCRVDVLSLPMHTRRVLAAKRIVIESGCGKVLNALHSTSQAVLIPRFTGRYCGTYSYVTDTRTHTM
jgi:hypothetical protein